MENYKESAETYRWSSSAVITRKGTIDQVRKHIPTFERRTFGPALLPVDRTLFSDDQPAQLHGFNPLYDVIVRKPLNQDEVMLPVGIVSPTYSLVQHQAVIDEVLTAIDTVGIKRDEVKAELDLSLHGERMRLGLIFPDKFGFEVTRGDRLAFRLDCYNTVDGSMKFMVVVGWLRVVCSNGMVVQERDSCYRRRHNKYLEMKDIAAILQEGIAATTREQATYRAWREKKVTEEKLAQWVDGELAKAWGVKAAARTWHITRSGHDIKLVDPFEKGKPTQKTVATTVKVPGAILPGETVYAVSQSLSWLAKERRDIQEQLEWKQQIPELLKPLLRNNRA